MSSPFLGEIRAVGFNFAPTGWATCSGQILAISQNTALFSLIGTFYGGNGTSNFQLPNLQGRVVIGAGSGPGLSPYDLGEQVGTESVTLLQSEIPAHNHNVSASAASATTSDPTGAVFAKPSIPARFQKEYSSGVANATGSAVSVTGANTAHENRMPFVAMQYVIALSGVFPARG